MLKTVEIPDNTGNFSALKQDFSFPEVSDKIRSRVASCPKIPLYQELTRASAAVKPTVHILVLMIVMLVIFKWSQEWQRQNLPAQMWLFREGIVYAKECMFLQTKFSDSQSCLLYFVKYWIDNWMFNFSYSRHIFNSNRLSYFSM